MNAALLGWFYAACHSLGQETHTSLCRSSRKLVRAISLAGTVNYDICLRSFRNMVRLALRSGKDTPLFNFTNILPLGGK